MAGFVPAISLMEAPCPPSRGARDKLGHDSDKGSIRLH